MKATDSYDALTLELERAGVLTGLIEDRLMELSQGNEDQNELYALSLVATQILDKLKLIHHHAKALPTVSRKKSGA